MCPLVYPMYVVLQSYFSTRKHSYQNVMISKQNCYFTSYFYYAMMILVKNFKNDLKERGTI
jgi:hypothetical protein